VKWVVARRKHLAILGAQQIGEIVMEAAGRIAFRKSLKSTLRELGFKYSARARAQRGALFRSAFPLTEKTTVLDLGGGNGAHLRATLAGTPVQAENVCVADVSERDLAQAALHGHRTVQLPTSGGLPFKDQEFDLVWCSSVIEHVTGDKELLWERRNGDFASEALVHQRAFAEEIRRIGKAFWVQTPARSFPVEQHLWMPLVHWLPRRIQVAACEWALKYWPHGSIPDIHLLGKSQMKALFPEAKLLAEKAFGLTKSWIAVA
jgi:SAM-dependent methyltransferase